MFVLGMGRELTELFDDTFVPPGLDDVWFATRGCPACLARPSKLSACGAGGG